MNTKRIFTIALILAFTLSLAPGSRPIQAAPRMETTPAIEAEAFPGNEDASQVVSLPEGVSEDWWANTQAYLQQTEYEITWQEPTYLADLPGAYQAPNRAQGLRIYFTPQGIRLMARTETDPTWQLGIALSGYGDQENIQPVGEATLSPAGNSMDYQREGLEERYVNTEAGLEQRFILQPFASSNLYLDLALQGELTPTLAMDSSGIEFIKLDGSLVLRYGEIKALDDAGQALPVELALLFDRPVGGATLRLILPPFTQPVTLTASLISPLEAERLPAILPTTHDWTYRGDQEEGEVGFSVGTAGDVNDDGYDDILVGAPYYDDGSANEGRVFLWHGGPDGLGTPYREPDWSAVGNQINAGIGFSVGTAGDVNGDGISDIIVGAPNYSSDDEGAAFVWYGPIYAQVDPDTPTDADWQAESDQAAAWFGFSVGTAGDVDGDGYDDILVGARLYHNGQNNEGAVFVWYGADQGLCTGGSPCQDNLGDADWKYESEKVDTNLGYSVGTAGDVDGDGYADILVGTPYYDGGLVDEGAIFLWYGSVEGMGDPQTPPDWTYQSNQAGAYLGESVNTAGDVDGDGYADILVGTPYYDGGQGDEGAIYIWYGSAEGIGDPQRDPDWMYESNQGGVRLGESVNTAGDVNGDGYADILVGAPIYFNGQWYEGAVYLWYGSTAGMSFGQRPPDWKCESNLENYWFGFSVSTAGDVNGDGYSDLLIGTPYAYSTWTHVGQVYAYYGSPVGPLRFAGAGNPEPQVSASFGFSVSTAGDVNGDGYSDIIVGAPNFDTTHADQGKVFVWHGSYDSWEIMKTTPNQVFVGEHGSDYFGFSVGTAGDVNGDGYSDIIIGAHCYESDPSEESEGAVYVWHGSAEGLPDSYAWKAESNRYGTDMGYSVSTAGDVNGDGYDDIIVGAPYYNNELNDEGAVYIWKGSNTGLCKDEFGNACLPDWLQEGNQASDFFGSSVGTAGDVNGDGYSDVIIGAHWYESDPSDQSEGAVFVYYGDELNMQTDYWKYESNYYGADLGYSVGTAGDVNGDGYADILAGAPYYDGGQSDEGAIFLWYGSTEGMGDPQRDPDWRYESNQSYAHLGESVNTAGDVNGDGYADILAGAPYYDGGLVDEGAIFLWYGSVEGVGEIQRDPDWLYESDQGAVHFGISVGTAGDVNGDGYSDILIGAPLVFELYGSAGNVYVFHGSGSGLSGGDLEKIMGNMENAQLGFSVDSAGDVNGDGYADVIVGAPFYDNGQDSEGMLFVYYGSAMGLDPGNAWLAESNQATAHFGSAVGSAGDVNGDGYGDVIAGAPGYADGQVEEGIAFVWHGSSTGLGSNGNPTTANWNAQGDQVQAYFGSAVATAGDVNGDGFGDVIIGAYGYDHGQAIEGTARVYYGSATGLATSPAWTAESDQASAAFGWSVGSAGDVNGDGCSDVIVGAYKYTQGELNEGRVYVYHGDPLGLSSTPDWTAEGNQTQAFFGYAVNTAGDVNGDGYSDVIVGASQYTSGETWRDLYIGAAFVWHGSSVGLGDYYTANWVAYGDQTFGFFGYSVSTAGDVNGDGYSDVIIGAPAYNNGPEGEGRAFVYIGSATGLSFPVYWTGEGDQPGASFGKTVATAGDITGDGFADVIVGAPNFDDMEAGYLDLEDVGLARVYYGNGKGALSLLPRQMRASTETPIAPLGTSDSETSVELRLNGRMPLGRERVKLEWQVAPLGTPFWGASVVKGISTDWTDTGISGVEIVQQVDGLSTGTAYHWRVRLVYSGNALGLSVSRWFSPAWNGRQEQDFRTKGAYVEPVNIRLYLPVIVK